MCCFSWSKHGRSQSVLDLSIHENFMQSCCEEQTYSRQIYSFSLKWMLVNKDWVDFQAINEDNFLLFVFQRLVLKKQIHLFKKDRNTNLSVNKRPIFAPKVSKEEHGFAALYHNNSFLENSGPLKIVLFLYYVLFWIHTLDAICTYWRSPRISLRM